MPGPDCLSLQRGREAVAREGHSSAVVRMKRAHFTDFLQSVTAGGLPTGNGLTLTGKSPFGAGTVDLGVPKSLFLPFPRAPAVASAGQMWGSGFHRWTLRSKGEAFLPMRASPRLATPPAGLCHWT